MSDSRKHHTFLSRKHLIFKYNIYFKPCQVHKFSPFPFNSKIQKSTLTNKTAVTIPLCYRYGIRAQYAVSSVTSVASVFTVDAASDSSVSSHGSVSLSDGNVVSLGVSQGISCGDAVSSDGVVTSSVEFVSHSSDPALFDGNRGVVPVDG